MPNTLGLSFKREMLLKKAVLTWVKERLMRTAKSWTMETWEALTFSFLKESLPFFQNTLFNWHSINNWWWAKGCQGHQASLRDCQWQMTLQGWDNLKQKWIPSPPPTLMNFYHFWRIIQVHPKKSCTIFLHQFRLVWKLNYACFPIYTFFLQACNERHYFFV